MRRWSVALIVLAAVTLSLNAHPEDVELARLPTALAAMPDLLKPFESELEDDISLDSAGRLWRRASEHCRRQFDDRGLYWARLRLLALAEDTPGDASMHQALERRTRGMGDVRYPDDTDLKILVSGFDPFHLDRNIRQSNPSGVAALCMDNQRYSVGGRDVSVQAIVVPVRFVDFDAGLIEAVFGQIIREHAPDMIVTISMGRNQFDLERFPGLRRSSPVTDNRNVLTGASPESPLVPSLGGQPLDGPEFFEFSLPADAMTGHKGRWEVRDNREVATLERGALRAASLAALAGQTAVAGSGGGYLSNEIAYRMLRLVQTLGQEIPTGHLHTPSLIGYDRKLERQMVQQIEAVILAGAASI